MKEFNTNRWQLGIIVRRSTNWNKCWTNIQKSSWWQLDNILLTRNPVVLNVKIWKTFTIKKVTDLQNAQWNQFNVARPKTRSWPSPFTGAYRSRDVLWIKKRISKTPQTSREVCLFHTSPWRVILAKYCRVSTRFHVCAKCRHSPDWRQ